MSAQSPSNSALTRETILRALNSLSEELGKQGVTGEVCLFGGTVMVLAFTARLSTNDVDALFQPAHYTGRGLLRHSPDCAQCFCSKARRLSARAISS